MNVCGQCQFSQPPWGSGSPLSATEAQGAHRADHTVAGGFGSWTAGPQSPPSGDLRYSPRCSRSQRHLDTRTQLLAWDSVPMEAQGLRLRPVKWAQGCAKRKTSWLREPCPPPQQWLSLLLSLLHSVSGTALKEASHFPHPNPKPGIHLVPGGRPELCPCGLRGAGPGTP